MNLQQAYKLLASARSNAADRDFLTFSDLPGRCPFSASTRDKFLRHSMHPTNKLVDQAITSPMLRFVAIDPTLHLTIFHSVTPCFSNNEHVLVAVEGDDLQASHLVQLPADAFQSVSIAIARDGDRHDLGLQALDISPLECRNKATISANAAAAPANADADAEAEAAEAQEPLVSAADLGFTQVTYPEGPVFTLVPTVFPLAPEEVFSLQGHLITEPIPLALQSSVDPNLLKWIKFFHTTLTKNGAMCNSVNGTLFYPQEVTRNNDGDGEHPGLPAVLLGLNARLTDFPSLVSNPVPLANPLHNLTKDDITLSIWEKFRPFVSSLPPPQQNIGNLPREPLSMYHAGQVYETISQFPNQQNMSLYDADGNKLRKLYRLQNYTVADESIFGLPLEQSILYYNVPLLPDDHQNFGYHFETAAKECLKGNILPDHSTKYSMNDVKMIAEKIKADTAKEVCTSKDKFDAFGFEAFVQKELHNMGLTIIVQDQVTSLSENVGTLTKNVIGLSQAVISSNEAITSNKEAITSNKEAISSNKEAISSNTKLLGRAVTNLAMNADRRSLENSERISSNEDDISTMKEAIRTMSAFFSFGLTSAQARAAPAPAAPASGATPAPAPGTTPAAASFTFGSSTPAPAAPAFGVPAPSAPMAFGSTSAAAPGGFVSTPAPSTGMNFGSTTSAEGAPFGSTTPAAAPGGFEAPAAAAAAGSTTPAATFGSAPTPAANN